MKPKARPKPGGKNKFPKKDIFDKKILQRELEMFHRIIEGMREDLSYVDLLKLTVTCVCKGLGYDRAGIFLVEPDGKTIARAVGVDAKGRFEVGHDHVDALSSKRGFSIFSDLVHGYRTFFHTSNLLKLYPDSRGVEKGVTCNANVPISVGKKKIIGVLAVDNLFTQRRLTRQDIGSLVNFATQAGMALETIRLHEQVRQLSVTDPLTRTYNRRYFEKYLEDEITRSKRYKRSCGLLYLDADHFKKINDRFGHPAGDEVLKSIAQFLRSDLRTIDVVARLGGDEFGVILPEIHSAGVLTVAQRLHQKISGALPPVEALAKAGHKVTLSIGVAAFPENGDSAGELIKKADASLYLAKTSGRNRIGPFIPHHGPVTHP
jgi:diguanylate cyclase (GGDEF)-like protein